MSSGTKLVGLILGLAIISLVTACANATAPAVADKTAPAAARETVLDVTGTVTARNGSIITLKTDDGKVYTVDAASSVVILDRLPGPGNFVSLGVGDRLRAYGLETGPGQIRASRLRLFVPESEAAAASTPAGTGAGGGGAKDDHDVQVPSVGDSLGSWRSRGLVVGVRYPERTLTIATSQGPFVIDGSVATIVEASRTISLASIGEGDTVRIWGDVVGLNRIQADRIEVIRRKSRQDSAVPLRPVSVVGRITSIDYPSFTFKIDTGAGDLNILADENTFIHFGLERKAFQNLALGQTVKISGIGSLNTGYVADEILIVSAPKQ